MTTRLAATEARTPFWRKSMSKRVMMPSSFEIASEDGPGNAPEHTHI